jgi:KUP system potassium uptake protein
MADTQAAPGHPDSAAPTESALPEAHHKASFWTLALGSVGVVYGDIGTSPLYALREAVAAVSDGGPPTRDAVIGVLSLILWSLTLVVTSNTSSSCCAPTTTAKAAP